MFAALSFVGFEAATTLADEAREPRRIVPRAVLWSVAGVGALYVFCIWAEVVGLGADKTNALDGTSTPWNDLAATYASWMKWPVIVASVSSMFAVMINSSNGIVRILNTMGREGLLPRMLAYIDPRHLTPSHAVFATGAFTLVARADRRRDQPAGSATRWPARTSTATWASCSRSASSRSTCSPTLRRRATSPAPGAST